MKSVWITLACVWAGVLLSLFDKWAGAAVVVVSGIIGMVVIWRELS